MGAWKFYAAERERWPHLSGIEISEAWAHRALKKLARHFKLPLDAKTINGRPRWRRVPLAWARADATTSWGGWFDTDVAGRGTGYGINLAPGVSWLTFAHEFAHVLDAAKRGNTHHDKKLKRIVDRICRYIAAKGWADSDLDEQFEAFCLKQQGPTGPVIAAVLEASEVSIRAVEEVRDNWKKNWPEVEKFTERATRLAASAEDRAEKIEKRKAQIKRLERKFKNINTRLKKARRSLAALERANAK